MKVLKLIDVLSQHPGKRFFHVAECARVVNRENEIMFDDGAYLQQDFPMADGDRNLRLDGEDTSTVAEILGRYAGENFSFSVLDSPFALYVSESEKAVYLGLKAAGPEMFASDAVILEI